MEVGTWHELFAVLGALVASAFALARLALGLQRGMIDRFVAFMERSWEHQQAGHDRLIEAVNKVEQGLSENSMVLRRMSEKMLITFHEKEDS